MTRFSKLKILFCIKIFFALFNSITSNEDIFDKMSLEDRKSFFGTEDGSVPEFQLVEVKSPSRSKRSPEEPLEVSFNVLGGFSTVSLRVVTDSQLINPRLTGIWSAKTNPESYNNISYNPMPELFDSIGKFDLLQNVDGCSAVARFWDDKGEVHYIGTVKLMYTVKNVPKNFKYAFFNDNHGKRSVDATKNGNEETDLLVIYKNKEIPQEYFRRHNFEKNAARPDLLRSRRQSDNVPDVVTSKLLLVPDYATVKRFSKPVELIRQLIAQLNVVDMIYRQLKDPEVHINIAGIIIPQDDSATPYLLENTHREIEGSINLDYAALSVREYFQFEERRFPHDTWDAVVVLSSTPMHALDRYTGDFIPIQGVGQYDLGCSGGAAIVKYAENMEGPHYIAHELGHLFSLRHDEEDTSANCKIDEGNTMVPNFGLVQKLEWSACSREIMRTFFRSDAGKCTYSPPEEVDDAIKSMPGAWLSLDGQCDNEFNDSTEYCHKGENSCDVIGCQRQGICAWLTQRPLEGSLYWESDSSYKACINGVWSSV